MVRLWLCVVLPVHSIKNVWTQNAPFCNVRRLVLLYIIHNHSYKLPTPFSKMKRSGGDDEHSHCCCYLCWCGCETRWYGWLYCNTMIPSNPWNLIKYFFRLAHIFSFLFFFSCTANTVAMRSQQVRGVAMGFYFSIGYTNLFI